MFNCAHTSHLPYTDIWLLLMIALFMLATNDATDTAHLPLTSTPEIKEKPAENSIPDPTQPSTLASPTEPSAEEAVDDNNGHQPLRLFQILQSSSGLTAIINGQRLQEGDSINQYKIMKIQLYAVTLSDGDKISTISLFDQPRPKESMTDHSNTTDPSTATLDDASAVTIPGASKNDINE